ncbi:hypothetical protein GCM10022276_06470 [Sphingomonas limnosediminicola]|uniref:Alpha-L-glutamate ligase-related protein ATP-grasp domain-containing protein n=1 Tax=Sphingomonas limnosediminicola TaxID=940133 RepID=A0ABP7KY75_9SPHN
MASFWRPTAERIVYRVAGLPIALLWFGPAGDDSSDPLQAAFAWRYWHPSGMGEWSELVTAMLVWPIAVLLAALWFSAKNGAVVRRRYGKPLTKQFLEQLRFYFSAGVLPPWYYIFSLHDAGDRRALTFIQRFETKPCYFPLLKPRKGSPLNDKARFADYCTQHGIRCVRTLIHLKGEHPGTPLPDKDLFVKPCTGRGGRGAERWDRIAPRTYANTCGEQLTGRQLLERLIARSRQEPLIVQLRMRAHRDLLSLTAGALPTIRVLTCLNAEHEPEVMAAMLRTSFGHNVTVDNLHAGGIGALVDLESGHLSRSSNIGSDARLGWFSTHPDTGSAIEGRAVPLWSEAKSLAIGAHREFNDRIAIGWDVAILDDGPIIVEGNGNPDLDILQRFMRVGLRDHRFADLLAYHLRKKRTAA